MGKLHAGPYGDLSGRTGNNVGRYVKGQNIFSVRPHKSSKPATGRQLNQRLIFGVGVKFVSRLDSLVEEGFGAYDSTMSAMNAAASYNIKNAITGVAPDYQIDYPKFKFSKGNLKLPFSTGVVNTTLGSIVFSWAQIEGRSNALGTDNANFVLYNPEKDVFVTLTGISRSALTCNMNVPARFSGDIVHCYMNFVSEDGKRVSDTVYVDELTLL